VIGWACLAALAAWSWRVGTRALRLRAGRRRLGLLAPPAPPVPTMAIVGRLKLRDPCGHLAAVCDGGCAARRRPRPPPTSLPSDGTPMSG